MIVDARMDTWEILTRFVQKKTTKKEMICVKTPNADPMQFVIWANVFALQDSKEMIPMTLLLVVLLYPNVLTIRIVATTKYVPFCLIQCIGKVFNFDFVLYFFLNVNFFERGNSKIDHVL